MSMTFGASVEWLTDNGGSMKVSSEGHLSRAEACQDAYASALRFGYRPPRWWEFRRRSSELDYPRIWRDELTS